MDSSNCFASLWWFLFCSSETFALLQGKLLASDSFPGQDRTKLCMASKVCNQSVFSMSKSFAMMSQCVDE